MPRSSIPVLLILALCRSASSATPLTQPAPLNLLPQFAHLLSSADLYHSLRTGGHWETLCDERFTDPSHPAWRTDAPPMYAIGFNPGGDPSANAMPQPNVEVIDGAPALVMDASQFRIMQIAVGPPVHCDLAIEVVARHLSDGVNGISLVLDGIDSGPGFRFACNHAASNELWLPRPPPPAGKKMLPFPFGVSLGGAPLVQSGAWTRIRFELRDGNVSAAINGQWIGSARLISNPDFFSNLHNAEIFVDHSSIAIRQVLVQHYAVLKRPLPQDQAWPRAFGTLSSQQVKQQIDSLIDLLADDNPQVRDAAQQALLRLADLAEPDLEQATKSDQAEIARRAAWVMKYLNPDLPKPPPLPGQLQQIQLQGFMWAGQDVQAIERQIFMQTVIVND